MMRLRLTHRTGFQYDSTVVGSYNEARMTPQTGPDQTTFSATLKVSPNPWQITYRDYWGTTVTSFETHTSHQELAVVAECTVETHVRPPEDVETSATWDDLRAPDVAARLPEFLEISPLTEPGPDLRRVTAELAAQHSPHETALAVCQYVHDQVSYVQGVTEVSTHAIDAWNSREGVCQDMAHLSVGSLRSAGIPARYVSGYLHPSAEPVLGEKITGESHAWVEWWAGAWFGFDPTNAVPYSDRHVVVSKGRDYSDVMPLRGIYAGGDTSAMYVEVDVIRIA